MKFNTVQSRVAGTILQRQMLIPIGGRTFKVSPPSIATLILVSEAISSVPDLRIERKNMFDDTLRIAKDCRIIGDIVAILILGARDINKEKRVVWWNPLSWFRRDNRRKIADYVLEQLTPDDLKKLFVAILEKMQVSSFFEISTFLKDINLTRPTQTDPAKVDKTATAVTASGE